MAAYAIAGTLNIDFESDPIGRDSEGNPVMLADIWPTDTEIREVMAQAITPEMFNERYATVMSEPRWDSIPITVILPRAPESTYVRLPSFFEEFNRNRTDFLD